MSEFYVTMADVLCPCGEDIPVDALFWRLAEDFFPGLCRRSTFIAVCEDCAKYGSNSR